MKKTLIILVALLFSANLHAYEVEVAEPTTIDTYYEPDFVETPSDEPKPPPPVATIVDKPFISFECEAELNLSKKSTDEKGLTQIHQVKNMKKKLGRLQPNEKWFKQSNRGSIDFDFRVKDKTLAFELILQGPEPGDDDDLNSLLNIRLGYHKTFKGEGKNRKLASLEMNDIHLDGDKTLPGGFSLSVRMGEQAVKDHLASVKVHCKDPKKEIRQIEVYDL